MALRVAHAGARDAGRALVGELHALRCAAVSPRTPGPRPSLRTQKQPPAMVAIFRLGAEGVTSGEGAGRSVSSAASGLRGALPPEPIIRSRRACTACVLMPVPRAGGGGADLCVASEGGARRRDERARGAELGRSRDARIPEDLH